MRRPIRTELGLLVLLATLLTALGCVSPLKRDVYQDGGIEVFLRGEKRFTTPVEKHFSHPVTISASRMAHILSRLDLRVNAAPDCATGLRRQARQSVAAAG